MSTGTEWIAEGTKVVVYDGTLGSTRWKTSSVKTTTIIRVSKKTFTVTDGTRFPIEPQPNIQQRGRWSASTYCAPLGSEKADIALKEVADRRAENRCTIAVKAWEQNPTNQKAAAMVVAQFQALVDRLEAKS